MKNKDIEKRKENIIKFFKERKGWIQYVLLAIILWIAFFIRKQNWDLLKDVTTGKYISLEVDSALFLRYAQYIAEHGRLFDIDMMRNFPFGVTIDFGTYTSYFIAYLWKILSGIGFDVSVEFVQVIYPTVATMILTTFFFLLIRRLFDYRVALLSSLFLVTSQAFLFRSISSDHDILGLMFVFMTLYFFVVGWQSKKVKYNLLFGVLAALSTIFSFHTAGNIRLFSVMISLFILIHIFLDNPRKSDFYIYPTWFLVSGVALLFTTNMGFYGVFLDPLNTLPATIAFFSLVIYYFLSSPYVNRIKVYNTLLKKVPKGVIALLFVMVFGFLFIFFILGFSYLSNFLNHIQNIFSSGLGVNRWASTVSENSRVFVVNWFSSFGRAFVFLFLAGFIILLYRLFKNLKDHHRLFYIFSFCLLAFIFSRYSPDSILNGSSTLSNVMFYGSILLLIFYTLYYYIYNYYKEALAGRKFFINLDWHYSLVLVMTLVSVVLGTTAIRLFFELSPFILLLSALTIIFLFDYFLSLKTSALKWLGIIFILLLLFSPLSFAQGIVFNNYKTSFNQVEFSYPAYNSQWQKAGEWVRENTPADSVFLHWWDYGYWVQGGFNRATVSDGGNRWGWWNYLTARYVLTAPKDEDALGFMYTHDVDYFLMVGEDIGKYSAYSLIGSDHNFDRFSYLSVMGMDTSLSRDETNQTVLVYRGGYNLDEDFIHNGVLYQKGTPIIALILNLQKAFDENNNLVGSQILQPHVILVNNGQPVELTLKCIYIDKLYNFEDYDYGGCARIIPAIEGQQANNLGAALFLSRRVADSFVGRLYVLENESNYFELVYSDAGNGSPLAMYNGRQIGPMKVWKVKYPEGYTVNETDYKYYTRTDYPDLTLMSF